MRGGRRVVYGKVESRKDWYSRLISFLAIGEREGEMYVGQENLRQISYSPITAP